jgi:hypothetical protein
LYDRHIKITFAYPEELKGKITATNKGPQIPGQLRGYKSKNNDPDLKNLHAQLGINIFLLTGKRKSADDSFYGKKTRKGENGHMQDFQKGILAAGEHQENHTRSKGHNGGEK